MLGKEIYAFLICIVDDFFNRRRIGGRKRDATGLLRPFFFFNCDPVFYKLFNKEFCTCSARIWNRSPNRKLLHSSRDRAADELKRGKFRSVDTSLITRTFWSGFYLTLESKGRKGRINA